MSTIGFKPRFFKRSSTGKGQILTGCIALMFMLLSLNSMSSKNDENKMRVEPSSKVRDPSFTFAEREEEEEESLSINAVSSSSSSSTFSETGEEGEEEEEESHVTNHNDAAILTSPPNVLFIKVPKTGGTTLSVMLQRYGREFNKQVAHPLGASAAVQTCGGNAESSRANWKNFVQGNGGKIEIFASHSCYIPEMTDPRYWKYGKRPLVITLLRDPFSTLVSEFRYIRKCCMKMPTMSKQKRASSWCKSYCSYVTKSFPQFVSSHCPSGRGKGRRCSEQITFVGGASSSGMGADVAKIVKKYDYVFLLERLDESLSLFALEQNFPFHLLPSIAANPNTIVPYPKFSESFKKTTTETVLSLDFRLYSAANRTLTNRIEKLSGEDSQKFRDILQRLISTNRQIKTLCRDRRGEDCVVSHPLLRHASGCFTECVEAVADGEVDPDKLPKVPICVSSSSSSSYSDSDSDSISTAVDRRNRRRGKCKKFGVSCQECECQSDGTAKCSEFVDKPCFSVHPKCLDGGRGGGANADDGDDDDGEEKGEDEEIQSEIMTALPPPSEIDDRESVESFEEDLSVLEKREGEGVIDQRDRNDIRDEDDEDR